MNELQIRKAQVEQVEIIDAEILGQCEIAFERYCTGTATLQEDPYEADVNNTPGIMIWVCDACLHEIAMDI